MHQPSRRPSIRPRTFERRAVVALLAFDSETASMNIVTGMTGSADHRWLDDVLRADVAIGATDLCVRAQQREAGVSRVIEIPQLPAVRSVAFAAILAETSIVHIVLCMAAGTLPGRIIEPLAGMALAAADDDVQSGQRILRLIVVEIDVLPLCGVVAPLALLAERAAMRLSGAVTVDALRTELLVLGHRGMTGVTIELRVRALEGKFEARQMVEVRDFPDIIAVTVAARRAQATDVFVIGLMATGAILRDRIVQIAAAMAVAAADPGVAPEQGKAGFPSMVEFL